jgi:hypothetical protein
MRFFTLGSFFITKEAQTVVSANFHRKSYELIFTEWAELQFGQYF